MAGHELSNLDLSKIAALQHKRTLAFVNHFVSTNVQFLNSFMKKCEHKLMQFERKLEKVEAAMMLLEDRLSSIPELNTITAPENEKPVVQPPTGTTQQDNPSIENTKQDTTEQNIKEKDKGNQDKSENVIVDSKTDPVVQVPPEYMRFVKMVQVGVPVEAVKLKASLEGLDPDILVKVLGK